MSLDYECWRAKTAISRRNQPNYIQKEKASPVTQTVISWVVMLGFIFLACDHGWWSNAMKENKREGAYPGSPVFQQALEDLTKNSEEFKQLVVSGKLTVEDAARIQYKGIDCLGKMGRDWGIYSSGIYDQAREFYVKNWKPEGWLKLHVKTETDRQTYGGWDFGKKLEEAKNRIPRPGCIKPLELKLSSFIWFCLWVLKWYFLMTIPSIVVMLIGKAYEGLSVKEEILLQPGRLLQACLGGPIGVFAMSETAAKVYRYRKLELQYRQTRKSEDYYLTEIEKEVIWKQVYEPLLSFDQAFAEIRITGEKVRRPLAACAIAWVFSLNYHQAPTQVEATFPVVMMSDTGKGIETSLHATESLPKGKTTSSLVNLLLLAILPGLVTWPGKEFKLQAPTSTTQPLQRFSWNVEKPRGPPSPLVRKNQTSTALCLSGLATVTEG